MFDPAKRMKPVALSGLVFGLGVCVVCHYLGMGPNETTRGPQVLVHVSIYQGSILGTDV